MLMLADPRTYWLNITNIALGIATVIFVAVICRTAFQDLRERRKH